MIFLKLLKSSKDHLTNLAERQEFWPVVPLDQQFSEKKKIVWKFTLPKTKRLPQKIDG